MERHEATTGPRVDVVVNNHDYARYLRAAIDSALAQSYPGTRVIVVDDGSTDDSREIIRSYGDRITAVLKDNGGQASAMNAAMDRCGDGVVMFLDADDVLEPHAAERVAERFAADPGLARVHFRLGVIDASGRPTGELKPPARLPLAQGDLRRATVRHPFDVPWLPTTGNAFSAAALRRIMPIPEPEYRICADWYLVHVSSLAGRIGAIDEPLARYRVHPANGFTRSGADLDLVHMAQTVEFAAITRREIGRNARRLGVPYDPARVASMCDVANRAVLLRLTGPARPGDSATRLLRSGARACRARRDVAWPMKAMLMAWLTATLAAPRPAARGLGELFFLPERRRALNPLLGALHRT
jgi:glycosyltransferase involved in cell wall biosynthesis